MKLCLESTVRIQFKTDLLLHGVTLFFSGFRLHIAINDLSAVYTAFLLRTYHESKMSFRKFNSPVSKVSSQQPWHCFCFSVENRLVHVVLPIKQWAYREGLLKPEEGKLSGYLLTLMIIFYLQAGLIKPGLSS